MVAALSGVADVDAVTISMARLGGGDLNLTISAQAITIAVSVNTISKAMIAGWAGGRDIGILVGGVSGVAVDRTGCDNLANSRIDVNNRQTITKTR